MTKIDERLHEMYSARCTFSVNIGREELFKQKFPGNFNQDGKLFLHLRHSKNPELRDSSYRKFAK